MKFELKIRKRRASPRKLSGLTGRYEMCLIIFNDPQRFISLRISFHSYPNLTYNSLIIELLSLSRIYPGMGAFGRLRMGKQSEVARST